MNKVDLELAKQEFNRDRNIWTDLLLTRRFWYQDLLTRIADRQMTHILTLSSIAIAIISIIFPITDEGTFLSTFSFLILSISALIGTILVLWTIFHDQKRLPIMRDEELGAYEKFHKAALENYNKALLGNITKKDIQDYFSLREQIKAKIKALEDNKFIRKLIGLSYIGFLIFFFLGMISFLLSVFCQRIK